MIPGRQRAQKTPRSHALPYSDVASEIRLMEWLVDRGFPAMRSCPMKNGSLSGQINTKWGVYNIPCFEKVPGKSLEDADGTLQIVKGYGKTLGMLHSLMKEYPYPQERRDHKVLLKVIEKRLGQYHAPEPVMQKFARLSENLLICRFAQTITVLFIIILSRIMYSMTRKPGRTA